MIRFFGMEMHDYQQDFLAEKVEAHGLADSGSAARALLDAAAANPEKWGDIFRTVHCMRCDKLLDNLSTADNAWKKSKKPVSFGLSAEQEMFLAARVANEEGAELADSREPRCARHQQGSPHPHRLRDQAGRGMVSTILSAASPEDPATVIPFEVRYPATYPLFEMELHDYQEEWLAGKVAAHSLADSGSVACVLLDSAAAHPEMWGDIFRTVHCRH